MLFLLPVCDCKAVGGGLCCVSKQSQHKPTGGIDQGKGAAATKVTDETNSAVWINKKSPSSILTQKLSSCTISSAMIRIEIQCLLPKDEICI